MTSFIDLISEVKRTHLEEMRKDDSGYFECVITQPNLKHIFPVLEQYFGHPFKPEGVKPNKEAARFTSEFGGIEVQQTLYYFERDGMSNCAMIWPWGDKTKATLKIAQGKILK